MGRRRVSNHPFPLGVEHLKVPLVKKTILWYYNNAEGMRASSLWRTVGGVAECKTLFAPKAKETAYWTLDSYEFAHYNSMVKGGNGRDISLEVVTKVKISSWQNKSSVVQ